MNELSMNTSSPEASTSSVGSLSGGKRLIWVAAFAAASLGLAACDNRKDTSVGQKVDGAVQRTEQAAKNGMEQARESMSSASNSASTAAKDATDKAAAVIDDSAITAAVSAGLAKDPDLSAIRVDVDTKGGIVTLTGPAPTSAAKERASQIATGVKGVSSVNNQLVIKAS